MARPGGGGGVVRRSRYGSGGSEVSSSPGAGRGRAGLGWYSGGWELLPSLPRARCLEAVGALRVLAVGAAGADDEHRAAFAAAGSVGRHDDDGGGGGGGGGGW